MANASCAANFTSITPLLAKAGMGKLNISTVVSSCPDLCTLAWGTGNPDLSGIGANISYIIQAILTVIFGPLFCLVYYQNERITELQITFLDISAQFSITVAVAAVIRFYQHPPFYELAFLRSLTTMQFLSLLSTAAATGLDLSSGGRVIAIIVYCVIEFGFYVGLIGGLRSTKAGWVTLSELSAACKKYSHLLPWTAYVPPPPAAVHIPNIKSKDYLAIVKSHWTIFGLVLTAIACLGILYGICCALWWMFEHHPRLVLGLTSFAFSIGTLVGVVRMEKTRNVMNAITGAAFEDNQWGFGQLIALFLWAPLGVQICYYGIRRVFWPEEDAEPFTPEPEDDDPWGYDELKALYHKIRRTLRLEDPPKNYTTYPLFAAEKIDLEMQRLANDESAVTHDVGPDVPAMTQTKADVETTNDGGPAVIQSGVAPAAMTQIQDDVETVMRADDEAHPVIQLGVGPDVPAIIQTKADVETTNDERPAVIQSGVAPDVAAMTQIQDDVEIVMRADDEVHPAIQLGVAPDVPATTQIQDDVETTTDEVPAVLQMEGNEK